MAQNNLTRNLNQWDYISAYSDWMYRTYQKHVGKSIFDVGAGMGRMVQYYIQQSERIVATDIFENQVDFMNNKFQDFVQFTAVKVDLMEDDLSSYHNQFDTVLCINVLEHIEDDVLAVKKMKSLLVKNGKLIIFVPAIQKLYCSMDKNVSHYRRYDKGILKNIAKQCNMQVVDNRYFNMLGIVPYWIKGRRERTNGESFSSTLNEGNSKVYNIAAKILEPIENIISPPVGLSEVIVLKKTS